VTGLRRDAEGSRPRLRLLGLVTGVALALVLTGLGLGLKSWLGGGHTAAASPAGAPAGWVRPAVSSGNLANTSGVKITQLALTGEGGLIDLRYQVIDPNKAATLHDEKTPPAIVDEQSGIVANELFMQHSHSGPFTFGETYYLVFDNPGNLVRRGARVTVLLGNAQVEHVLVR
jgi:hypothetical protein